jgi:hypothetical protein
MCWSIDLYFVGNPQYFLDLQLKPRQIHLLNNITTILIWVGLSKQEEEEEQL